MVTDIAKKRLTEKNKINKENEENLTYFKAGVCPFCGSFNIKEKHIDVFWFVKFGNSMEYKCLDCERSMKTEYERYY